VAALYPEIVHAIVRVDSGITSLNQLEGKRVAVGAQGSGAAVEAEIVLRAAGLWEKVAPQYLDYNQAAEALKLGQIDAIIICTGLGTPSVAQLATTNPIRLLDIPDNVLDNIVKAGYTFFVRYVVPKDTYNGMDKDANTLAIKAMLAVRSDVPDDIVYEVLKVLFGHLDELQQAHARAKDISLNTALDGMPIILHPGAVKFYQEKGLTIPSALKP